MTEAVYTIVDYPKYNMESGRYKSSSPLAAAKKAFTRLQKKMDLTNNLEQKQYIEFTLRNKSTNQFYTYLGTRIQLNSPVTITQNGRTRTIDYKHSLSRKPKVLNLKTITKLVNRSNEEYNSMNNNAYVKEKSKLI
jgi:hypothetical protein